MKRINAVLAVIAAALFLLSIFTYRGSVERAERFERGQKFLPNLNPDEIAEVVITQGEEKTHLKRGEEYFTLVSAGGYPAKNEEVNRFLRALGEITLDKEVGTGAGLEEKLGLELEDENVMDVVLKDGAGDEMVRFLVGESLDDSGGGNYVRRADREENTIYLTSSRIYLALGSENYLDDEILDVGQDRIESIEGADFLIAREGDDGALELRDVPPESVDNSKLNQVRTALSFLRFTEHHLANADEVAGLVFDRELRFELDDRSGYVLRLAQAGDEHYLTVEGFLAADRIEVSAEDTEEKNQENAELLKRANEIQDFNQLHGSWVYEISESTADKLRLSKADLLAE